MTTQDPYHVEEDKYKLWSFEDFLALQALTEEFSFLSLNAEFMEWCHDLHMAGHECLDFPWCDPMEDVRYEAKADKPACVAVAQVEAVLVKKETVVAWPSLDKPVLSKPVLAEQAPADEALVPEEPLALEPELAPAEPEADEPALPLEPVPVQADGDVEAENDENDDENDEGDDNEDDDNEDPENGQNEDEYEVVYDDDVYEYEEDDESDEEYQYVLDDDDNDYEFDDFPWCNGAY
ncbi:hypothetical protein BC940DRAFT_324070 [Gongronella butleri]|nr:hypothetical protein BC940DRAFT_324070 [Gongronella butleri]